MSKKLGNIPTVTIPLRVSVPLKKLIYLYWGKGERNKGIEEIIIKHLIEHAEWMGLSASEKKQITTNRHRKTFEENQVPINPTVNHPVK